MLTGALTVSMLNFNRCFSLAMFAAETGFAVLNLADNLITL
jgi:hypothetical protein